MKREKDNSKIKLCFRRLRVRHQTPLNETFRNQEKKKLMSLTETMKDREGDQNLMAPSMPIRNGLMKRYYLLINAWC